MKLICYIGIPFLDRNRSRRGKRALRRRRGLGLAPGRSRWFSDCTVVAIASCVMIHVSSCLLSHFFFFFFLGAGVDTYFGYDITMVLYLLVYTLSRVQINQCINMLAKRTRCQSQNNPSNKRQSRVLQLIKYRWSLQTQASSMYTEQELNVTQSSKCPSIPSLIKYKITGKRERK